jgi:arginase
MTNVVVLDAPSNLGLRAPSPGVVPGCYKLAGALRDQGIVSRIGAEDVGVVVPPRYDVSGWKPGDGVFNAAAMARYTRRLADRVDALIGPRRAVLLLGGDCSILLGPMLALRRRGRYGLVYIDAHSDLRHVGNSPHVGAAAGEGLAQLTGRGQPDVVDLDGLAPYVRESDIAVLGLHEPDDSTLDETRSLFPVVLEVEQMRATDCAAAAARALDALPDVEGIWVHLDADVLDPSVMPAVDSPEPGGLLPAELTATLAPLLADPRVVGINVTIYDPDLDEDATAGALLTDAIVAAFVPAGR